MKSILFVCTGNTCRSPMAAALFRVAVKAAGLGFSSDSAGVSATNGASASKHAVRTMQYYKQSIATHKSKRVTSKLLSGSERVYAMTQRHADYMREMFPEHSAKIAVMPCGDVVDPYGGTIGDYIECAEQIEQGVKAIIADLLNAG